MAVSEVNFFRWMGGAKVYCQTGWGGHGRIGPPLDPPLGVGARCIAETDLWLDHSAASSSSPPACPVRFRMSGSPYCWYRLLQQLSRACVASLAYTSLLACDNVFSAHVHSQSAKAVSCLASIT